MEEFIFEITTMTAEYLGNEPQPLSVNLAIEQFKDCRNYPKSYDDEKILDDLKKNKSKIAMAVIEIDAKDGIEGQTGHSENGINRTYGNMNIPKAYVSVTPFVHVN